ncbi:hypothetical protein quinque_009372 [Culex quinquefasciatus]
MTGPAFPAAIDLSVQTRSGKELLDRPVSASAVLRSTEDKPQPKSTETSTSPTSPRETPANRSDQVTLPNLEVNDSPCDGEELKWCGATRSTRNAPRNTVRPEKMSSAWMKLFTNASIPLQAATGYASEYLPEMGITTMGDIIAIQRHSKTVCDQSARDRVLSSQSAVVEKPELPEHLTNLVPVAAVSATLSNPPKCSDKKASLVGS